MTYIFGVIAIFDKRLNGHMFDTIVCMPFLVGIITISPTLLGGTQEDLYIQFNFPPEAKKQYFEYTRYMSHVDTIPTKNG